MSMEKQYLDSVLVPMGILLMVAYHLWLLYRILKHPTKTVIGINAINRRFWVQAMMEDGSKGVLAVQSLRNNIMASTLLASTAIMLSSLIAILMTGGSSASDRSFWYYSHASILINVPLNKMSHRHQHLTLEYVANTVNRGSYFWSLGLRAFYFSFPLFLWIFGPLPMFFSCMALVFMLYFLDVTFQFGWAIGAVDDNGHNEDEEVGVVQLDRNPSNSYYQI
ncbi:uncharacterized protein LOC108487612 isoform X2 [Gossypium arboreum]|uniref:uncharacterized protein LOC108487612 isoform X2 n=1 Tax=Gossypium arboreum TaxID=29729 RepID=UPI000818FE40|nr:uncharacterized protein LOC108487612 isoform X2 [Gossypium arboreum]